MGGFHWPELIIIVTIALLVFGPKRLPEMGSSIGRTIREFQKSMREVTQPEQPATSATPALPPATNVAAVSGPETAAPNATESTPDVTSSLAAKTSTGTTAE